MMSGFCGSLTLNIGQLSKLGWVCQIRVTGTQFHFIKNIYRALGIVPGFPISSASYNYDDHLVHPDHSDWQVGCFVSTFFNRLMTEFCMGSFYIF